MNDYTTADERRVADLGCKHELELAADEALRSPEHCILTRRLIAHLGALLVALRHLLPLDQEGGCWYCKVGHAVDSELMHPDRDNCWGGAQRCLNHPDYSEARALLDEG